MIEEIFGDGHRSLFLVSLWEPEDNDLSVVVVEASPQGPEKNVGDVGLSAQEILPTPNSLAIEIAWTNCILYAIGNESYMTADPAVPFPNRMLVERKSSRFLDYVLAATWARDDYPGPIRHWALFCENHIVDVACLGEPAVRRVPMLPQWLERERPRVFQR